MIQKNDLIPDEVLYSCKWDYKSDSPTQDITHYVYLTKTKLYDYTYDNTIKAYTYEVCLVKDFSNIEHKPNHIASSGPETRSIHIMGRHDLCRPIREYFFQNTVEGRKISEELFIAIAKAMG